jgi:hypothetical protein
MINYAQQDITNIKYSNNTVYVHNIVYLQCTFSLLYVWKYGILEF